MKSVIFLLGSLALIVGCGGSAANDAGDTGNTDTITPVDVPADVADTTTPDAARDTTVADPGQADAWNDAADVQGHDIPADTGGDAPDAAADLSGDAPGDVSDDADDDAIASCTGWSLVNSAMLTAVMDDPAPLNAARTTRFRAAFILKCNQARAMPTVTVDPVARTVVVRPMVWENRGFACAGPDLMDERIIAVLPAASGKWTVVDGAGAEKLTFDVAAPPPDICLGDSHSSCNQDCDCADGVCLGGNGLGGPFTGCGRPCEYDQDCPPGNSCISADDGLDHYCDPTQNCLDSGDCPAGFECESKFCVPRYVLGQSSRHECTCDSECDPPLRCVEPAGAEKIADPVRRCEYACPSAGGWCPGAHVCGQAGDDLSGMAGTDSVCIWMGE